MRFLHLSDLHLGKRVCEFSMLDDQRYILEQILSLLDSRPVDAVLLAGDLYDKPVPPAEAVRLLDWFLTELSRRELPVFAISGNHDSADRVAFGSALLAESRVYVSPVFSGPPEPITLTDAHGPVDLYLLPFLKPAMVRHVWPDVPIESYNDALACVLDHCSPDPARRSVLVAHQFVTGADRSDSEETWVGGLDNVSAEVFKDFDYVALGHIHSPQNVGSEHIRYCGTTFEIFFFRGRTAEICDSCGAFGKRKSQDQGDSAEASSGYAKTERHIHGDHITVQLSGHKHRGLCADHADR